MDTKRFLRGVMALAIAASVVGTAGAHALGPNDGTRVMSGLANPRGLAWGPEGALYVAEAGRGGPPTPGPCFLIFGLTMCYGPNGAVSRLWHGRQERVVDNLPSYANVNSGRAAGPNGIALNGLGNAYVTIGLETDPVPVRALGSPELAQFGTLVRLAPAALSPGHGEGPDGASWELVADLAQYEIDVNPDCGDLDSNPFGVLADENDFIVADAGANALVRLAANGALSTLAAFRNNTTVPGPGCPEQGARDFVPTTIVRGPDGAYYFGHLNANPILAGSSSVWRMEPGGTPEEWRTGFTWIISVVFDRSGNLYVLQHSEGPTANVPGSLVRVAPDGTRETIITALPRPGGVAVDDEGGVYISMIPSGSFLGPGEVRRYVP
jgi:hypothetical protein